MGSRKFKNKIKLPLQKIIILFLSIFIVIACTEKKIEPPKPRNIITEKPVDNYRIFLNDKQNKEDLVNAIHQSIVYLDKVKDKEQFVYGSTEYSYLEIKQSMHLFLELLQNYNDPDLFLSEFKKNFDIHKSPGNQKKDGLVLFTGYFEPIVHASRVKTDRFQIPAYALPKDLKKLQLQAFRSNLKNTSIVYRLEKGKIIPYYTRKEIIEGALKSKAKPLVWFESHIDLFFLQLQGSGIIKLQDGHEIALGYAGANGRQYNSIGKLLVDKEIFKLEEVSMQSIINYLKTNPEKESEILFHNQSYTFFTEKTPSTGPIGSLNVNLTPRRSIATDYQIYPKGALMYIQTESPKCDQFGQCQGTMPIDQFIVNQDTGGAIRTHGRADIFWGRGEQAKAIAGRMRSKGDLYVIIAKKSALKNRQQNKE